MSTPRRVLKKRNRREFEDLEAEEKSDDSDVESEHGVERASEAVPREVAELQREMEARGDIGARGFGQNLAEMEERYRKQDELEKELQMDDIDDFLLPEVKLSPGGDEPPRKQRKLEQDDDAMSVVSRRSTRSAKVHAPIDATHKTLPTTTDPKLWRVKCFKTGIEKEFCANLINKFWHLVQSQGPAYLEDIPVYSVFAADATKGFVYIEAHREIDVRNYIKGIRLLNQWSISLVPSQEMIGVFNMATFAETQNKGTLKPGNWVRLKRGIYSNDLAMVLRVFDGSAQVRIKPRINFDNEPSTKRPRQQFFSLDTAKRLAHVNIAKQSKIGDLSCFEVNGDIFTSASGHLIKTVTKSQFEVRCETTLAEEEAFSNQLAPEAYTFHGDEVEQNARQVYRKTKDTVRGGVRKAQYFKDERIRVSSGQLAGLHCRIIEVLPNDHLRLAAEYASAEWKKIHGIESGIIDHPCELVEKFFEMGNRVKVLGGEHQGDTGTISKVDERDRCCAVVSETIENEGGFPLEYRVSTWDLTVTMEKETVSIENHGMKVGDLVCGPGKTIAIITLLGTKGGRVLTVQGHLVHWRYQEMALEKRFNDQQSISDREMQKEFANDKYGQKICRTWQVTVYATEKRRRMMGNVVHIVREPVSSAHILFLHDVTSLGDEKFVMALASECESRTASGSAMPKDVEKTLEAIQDKGLDALDNKTEILPGTKVCKRGRRVQIVSGAYKGLLAEIRAEIDDSYVRLQLVTKPKLMQMHKRNIRFCDMSGPGANMLEDLPPVVPPTPLPEICAANQLTSGEDPVDAVDPWDNRFKLPAPVRKKAEVAWDPTFRKTKLIEPPPAPPTDELEDDLDKNKAPGSPAENVGEIENDKLLEILDTAGDDVDMDGNERKSVVDVSMDELLTNPVSAREPNSPVAEPRSVRSSRSVRSTRSVRSDKTAVSKRSESEPQLTSPHSGQPGVAVPFWCQKGVRVTVMLNEEKVQAWIVVVLYENVFVKFDDGKTQKIPASKLILAPVSVGDYVLSLKEHPHRQIGKCRSVDSSDDPIAVVDFKHSKGEKIPLGMLARFKPKESGSARSNASARGRKESSDDERSVASSDGGIFRMTKKNVEKKADEWDASSITSQKSHGSRASSASRVSQWSRCPDISPGGHAPDNATAASPHISLPPSPAGSTARSLRSVASARSRCTREVMSRPRTPASGGGDIQEAVE